MGKTDDFLVLEKAVHSIRDINIQAGDEFCAYMGTGRSLLDMAEQISGRDETDTALWNELIREIHTIAAGTDDIPDKDEIGRDRQNEKTGCKCGAGGCRSGRPERAAPPVPSVQISALAGQVTGGFSLAEILPAAELLRDQILSDIEPEHFLPEEGVDYYFRAFETMRGILRMFALAISEDLFPSDVSEFYFKGELQADMHGGGLAYSLEWTPRQQS